MAGDLGRFWRMAEDRPPPRLSGVNEVTIVMDEWDVVKAVTEGMPCAFGIESVKRVPDIQLRGDWAKLVMEGLGEPVERKKITVGLSGTIGVAGGGNVYTEGSFLLTEDQIDTLANKLYIARCERDAEEEGERKRVAEEEKRRAEEEKRRAEEERRERRVIRRAKNYGGFGDYINIPYEVVRDMVKKMDDQPTASFITLEPDGTVHFNYTASGPVVTTFMGPY